MRSSIEQESVASVIAFARSFVGDRIERVLYLVPHEDELSGLCDEAIHVLREIRLDSMRLGSIYFTWVEEPELNGHPFRLNVAASTGFVNSTDLTWVDMSSDLRWQRVCSQPVLRMRIFEEEASYDNDLRSSRVVTGVEFDIEAFYVQISVVQPPLNYRRVPLNEPAWMASNTISVAFPPFDLGTRPDVGVVSI